jgi:TonB-linked SusC/RagA family outer membrane protein
MNRFITTLSLLLFVVTMAMAQRTVMGTVTGSDGEALIGASVIVKGANRGTVTDLNGRYTLEVPASGTALIFKYTGYTTQEIALGSSNVVEVTLQDGNVLEETVVVGYGTQQKRAITGTVATIKGNEIAQLPAQSFDQLLQGRAAGVNINIPNGVLNNPPVIRVRGINSINLSSIPLIVVDGVPTYTDQFSQSSAANNPLSSINPADIESVEVLKDAAASAIYGSRAAAGVMLITTKRGKAGKTKVSYDAWAGWTEATRVPKVLNADEYVTIKNEAAANAKLSGQQFFLDTIAGRKVDTRWADLIYRTGFSQNHNLGLGGGSDKTTYYLSLGYSSQEGMIVGNSFDRLSSRLNFDHAISSRFKVGGNIAYSQLANEAPNTGSLEGQAFNTSGMGRLAFVLAPIVDPYKYDASGVRLPGNAGYNVANNQLGQGKNKQSVGFANPAPVLDLNYNTSGGSQIQASAFGQYEIVNGLRFRTQYGIDNLNGENEIFQSAFHGDGVSSGGRATNIYVSNKRWNFQNTLEYTRNFSGVHDFGALVGHEEQATNRNGWGATRTSVADPFFTTYQGNYTTIDPIGNFQLKNYLLSYFGRLNYAYNNFFFLTANLRQDEYSAFAPGNQKGVFWGASAGFTLSELGFWKNGLGNNINYFKLRGSYGTVGNNAIGDFQSQYLYDSGLYGTAPTFVWTQAGNTDLSWETSKKLDVGFVFGAFNDRLQGEYTYFNNNIDGLILFAPQAPSRGIPGGTIPVNIGSMVNRGHEIGLSGVVLSMGKFSWRSNANLTLMENEVTELYNGTDILSTTSGLETTNITRVGEAVGSIYAVPTQGVNPDNGRRRFVKRDGTVVQYDHSSTPATRWTKLDGTATSAPSLVADGVVQGTALPKWYGGWDNTFSYGPVDLNVQMNYAGGNVIYNGSKAGLRDQRFWNNHTDVLDRWTENNRSGSIPRVVFGDNISNGSAFAISENVEKGDFLRIRNITLGYKIPEFTKYVSSARVYATINNAFLFTGYTGTDPEVSSNGNVNRTPGVDRNTVPMSRTYLMGINLNF